MIKAIIFDCFGVLATEGWLAFKQEHFGSDPDKMARATELSHLLDSGLISYDDSLQEVAAMAGVSPTELNKILKNVAPNEALLAYIAAELKPKYKIGLLSNVSDGWLYTLFSKQQLELFDAKVLSHEIGVIKPHPRAYETIAERLELSPKDCLFIDDQQGNVEGAEATGMKALKYSDFKQCTQQIETLTP